MAALKVGTPDDIGNKIRLLIYGPPGVGKTTFAANAPNPVFLDYENSTTALKGTKLSSIPVISDRKELAQYEKVLSFLRASNNYDTIIVDSISSMYETMLMHHMKHNTKSKDRHIALFADFRKEVNVLKEIFYELINLDKHIILVAHEKTRVDVDSNRVLEVRPYLPPTAEASVERLVNEVFYLESKSQLKGPSERILHVDSQGRILAKNRQVHLTEATYTNPTWEEIY